ncbi:MAG TPA: inositol monophosphatase family protein [Kofleriaceae bacterium]
MLPTRDLDTVVDIALAAGRVLAAAFSGGPAPLLGRRHVAGTTTGEFALVTATDRASAALLVARLAAAFPGDAILAEEGGGQAGGQAGDQGGEKTGADARWIVDPLDGTTNFVHGLPFFCVAIARERDGEVDLAVIHAPILELTFTAERGGGAHCNGRALRVSESASLERALLATGFPVDRESAANNFIQFAAVKRRARAVRRYGSASLDQAMVAAGTFDAYWEMRIKPWDVAPGSLIVSEAGGRVTGWLGERLRLEVGAIVASNGRIHDELLAVLADAGIPGAVR